MVQPRFVNAMMYAYQKGLTEKLGQAATVLNQAAITTLGDKIIKTVLSEEDKQLTKKRGSYKNKIKNLNKNIDRLLVRELKVCSSVKSTIKKPTQRSFQVNNCFLIPSASNLKQEKKICVLCPLALVLGSVIRKSIKKPLTLEIKPLISKKTCLLTILTRT